MKNNIIIVILVLVIGFVLGLLCRRTEYVETTIVERDTTVVVDTHIVERPVPVRVTVVDTMYAEVRDTIRMNDTLYVSLPLERKEYRRDEFYAVVSGYNPSLTYIEVFPKTVYVTETTRKKDKANYLSAGVDVLYLGTAHVPIYVEYERMLHRNFSVYARGMGDIWTGTKGLSVGVRAKIGW